MDAIISWAKASIADCHSSKNFNLFGYMVDKQDAMAAIVVVVLSAVWLFWLAAVGLDLLKRK